MLVVVQIENTAGAYVATAPDVPELCLKGQNLDQTIARAHLEIEVLLGLDDIDITLGHQSAIEAFERRYKPTVPWLYGAG